jgi:glycosyltransferase involved in cell wall biosynthesis
VAGAHLFSFADPPKSYANWISTWLVRRYKETEHCLKSYKWINSNFDDFDIVHNHVEYEGVALSNLCKRPCLTTLHGSLYTGLAIIPAKIYSMPKNTKLVTSSKHGYERFKKIYNEDIIGFVHNGLNMDVYPFVQTPLRTHQLQLCWLGRLIPAKGARIAIAVAEALHKKGYDVHLKLLAGYQSSSSSYYQAILNDVKNKPFVSIYFNRPRAEIASVLGNSDVSLFPFLVEELFGYVMTESMCCGTPVIAFPNGSPEEIITNGLNGFLCNNEKEMADRVLQISKIDRKKCRSIVEQKFSSETMYKGYLEMYKHVLNSDR